MYNQREGQGMGWAFFCFDNSVAAEAFRTVPGSHHWGSQLLVIRKYVRSTESAAANADAGGDQPTLVA